jgi:RimJ/RimL family protein N-acetyltransferase
MNNQKLLNLETERLIISEVTINDLEKIHQLHLIPEVDKFNTLGIPQTINDTEKIIIPLIEAQNKVQRSSYMWKIVIKETNEFIGVAGFSLSNDKFRLGEIYYKLNPKYWGNGYATELAKRLVILGFENFKLHKVEAGVATKNLKSIRVLEKIGMTREGLRRKILPIRGEWIDNYHYAIVEDDKRNY